jgi:hypothetical protein
LLNSRLGPYTATSGRSHREGDHGWRHPFFRSYGASLPSSLTWLLSRTLGFSPHPPVSVCGTDSLSSTHRRFSWQCGIGRSALSKGRRVPSRLRLVWPADLPFRPPYTLGLPQPIDSQPSLLRLSIAQTGKYRNINLLSIGYAFRPRLRVRLTLGGRTWPRKPRIFGGEDSHLSFRYSCLHDHLYTVDPAFRQNFALHTTLSYPFRLRGKPRHRFRT